MSNGTSSLIKDQPHIVRQVIAEHLTARTQEQQRSMTGHDKLCLDRGAMTYRQMIEALQQAIASDPQVADHPVTIYESTRSFSSILAIQHVPFGPHYVICEKLA